MFAKIKGQDRLMLIYRNNKNISQKCLCDKSSCRQFHLLWTLGSYCPLCRKFKRLMKIFTKTNIRKVKLQASKNFPFYFYPAKTLKRSDIAAFAWEIKRFVVASSSSFFHYFSGITRNSEQKNVLQIIGQLI